MRLQHDGAKYIFLTACTRCFDCQQLAVDVGHIHGSENRGQCSDIGGMDPHSVYETRDFHTSLLREITDQMTGIQYIAADGIRLIQNDSFHDIRSIFPGSFMSQIRIFRKRLAQVFPAFDLTDTASGIFIQRNVELIDHLRITGLDIKRIIFRIVFTGLCAVITQLVDIIITDHVMVLLCPVLFGCPLLDFRIKVMSLFILDRQKPGHMIDAGDQFLASI